MKIDINIEKSIDNLNRVIRLLKWVSSQDNKEKALSEYCSQYGFDEDIIKEIISADIELDPYDNDIVKRNKSDKLDTVSLVEAELSSELMLNRRQTMRRELYAKAISVVIEQLGGKLGEFARLRYIDLKSFDNIEIELGIGYPDVESLIKETNEKLICLKPYIKCIFNDLISIERINNYIDKLESSIQEYTNGKELTSFELKRYKTRDNVVNHYMGIQNEAKTTLEIEKKVLDDKIAEIKEMEIDIKHEHEKEEDVENNLCDIDMTIRLFNTLKRANINSLNDLSEFTEKQVKSIHNLGKKSYSELSVLLDKYAIKLKGE